jgi:hypothetical protein
MGFPGFDDAEPAVGRPGVVGQTSRRRLGPVLGDLVQDLLVLVLRHANPSKSNPTAMLNLRAHDTENMEMGPTAIIRIIVSCGKAPVLHSGSSCC